MICPNLKQNFTIWYAITMPGVHVFSRHINRTIYLSRCIMRLFYHMSLETCLSLYSTIIISLETFLSSSKKGFISSLKKSETYSLDNHTCSAHSEVEPLYHSIVFYVSFPVSNSFLALLSLLKSVLH